MEIRYISISKATGYDVSQVRSAMRATAHSYPCCPQDRSCRTARLYGSVRLVDHQGVARYRYPHRPVVLSGIKNSDCITTVSLAMSMAAIAYMANASEKRHDANFLVKLILFPGGIWSALACMTNVGELLIRNDCGITPVQNRKMSFFILLAPHRGFIDAINGSG